MSTNRDVERMRVLIVVATDLERAALETASQHDVDVVVTGVGMVSTAVRCARALAQHEYDVALNIGLCGSFDRALAPPAVVHVVKDRIAELGAEDGDAFLTLADLNLPGECEFVNHAPPASASLTVLPKVTGITVNTVHGAEGSIAGVVKRFNPQVESMEGAAFMHACLVSGVRFAQIRAVSNIVERRNRNAWKVTDAIDAVGRTAVRVLEEL